MNADIKERWLTALTDGSYEQGQGVLRGASGFCCLGVLCDLLAPTEWEPVDEQAEGAEDDIGCLGPFSLRGKIGMPPESVYEVAGLDRQFADDLAGLNDNGKTFTDIAEAIRLRA